MRLLKKNASLSMCWTEVLIQNKLDIADLKKNMKPKTFLIKKIFELIMPKFFCIAFFAYWKHNTSTFIMYV